MQISRQQTYHATDEANLAFPPFYLPAFAGTVPVLVPQLNDILRPKLRLDDAQSLIVWDHFILVPLVPTERHKLDEPHTDRMVFRQSYEIRHFRQVGGTSEDVVDLYSL